MYMTDQELVAKKDISMIVRILKWQHTKTPQKRFEQISVQLIILIYLEHFENMVIQNMNIWLLLFSSLLVLVSKTLVSFVSIQNTSKMTFLAYPTPVNPDFKSFYHFFQLHIKYQLLQCNPSSPDG